jgi:hypothetical protein
MTQDNKIELHIPGIMGFEKIPTATGALRNGEKRKNLGSNLQNSIDKEFDPARNFRCSVERDYSYH